MWLLILIIISGIIYCAYKLSQKSPTTCNTSFTPPPIAVEYSEIKKEEKGYIIPKSPRFIPSDSFIGSKRGYVFKMDDLGLGYYKDKKTVTFGGVEEFT